MREMKDSGIEWIGRIPSSWKTSKVKYFYDCYDGKRVPIDASLRKEGPYPYWGAGSITDHVDNYIFDEELVLVGEDGAPFFDKTRPVAFLINEKVWINNHIHVLKIKENTNPAFMAYFFNIVDYGSYINGSILNKLTQGNMNNIAFVFPCKEEEDHIVDYLDFKCSQIDSIIAKQEQIIEKLKEYKLSIITEAVTKGLNPDVEMKESGITFLGKIPSHWERGQIRYLHAGLTDGTHGTYERRDSGYLLLSAKNVREEKIEIGESESYISEDDYISIISNGFPKRNDVLLCCIGASIGRCILYDRDKPEAFQRSVIMIRSGDRIVPEYLMYSLRSSTSLAQEQILVNQSAQPGLYQGLVSRIQVPVPSIEEQKQIVNYLNCKLKAINNVIHKRETMVLRFQKYRESLIYEVVTGKKEI